MKRRSILIIIFGIITLSIQGIIFVESSFNSVISTEHSNGFTQWIIDLATRINPDSYISQNPDAFRAFARKLFGHFLIFGGLGFFSMITLSLLPEAFKQKKTQIVLASTAYGLGNALYSELIQTFVPGRAGMFQDILIDFCGYLLFSLAIFLILFIINNIREKKKDVSNLG